MVRQIDPVSGAPQTAAVEQRIRNLEARVAMLEMRLAAFPGDVPDGMDGRGEMDGNGDADGQTTAGGIPGPVDLTAGHFRPLTRHEYSAAATAARVASATARASAAARSASAAAKFAQARASWVVELWARRPEQPPR